MGRASLITLLMMGGCFDFDLLERPFDSAVPDLPAGADLASADFADFAVADLAGADLANVDLAASPDLNACAPVGTFIGRLVYVAPGGTGDGSGVNAPTGSINTAVQRAIMAPDPAYVLIASGSYVDNVSITGSVHVSLYGGYNTAFTCRDPSPGTTVLTAMAGGIAIVVNSGATFTVDGMTLKGGATAANAAGIGLAIDGAAGTVNGTISHCEVLSHDGAATVLSATGISVQASNLTVDHSHVFAGATGGTMTTTGIYLCSSSVTITDSTIETNDPGANHAQIAVDMPNASCGGTVTAALGVTRGKLLAGGSGAANTAFRLLLPSVTPSFAASALVAVGGTAMAANNVAGPLAVSFVGCTLNGTGNAGGRGLNVANTTQLMLSTQDTIYYAVVPIAVGGPANQLTVNHMGINLLHASASTTVLSSTDAPMNIAAYNSMVDSTAIDANPALSTSDYVHLGAGSMAVDKIPGPTCSTPKDIDGDTRPQGGACDIGADEQ
jgi:hypothetical protein